MVLCLLPIKFGQRHELKEGESLGAASFQLEELFDQTAATQNVHPRCHQFQVHGQHVLPLLGCIQDTDMDTM